MSTLVLVRHGQASFGARDYDLLSSIGEQQGTLLGEHWRRCRLGFDATYSGAMHRQRVTAERALTAMNRQAADIRTDAAFNEYEHQGLIRAYLPVIARDNPEFSVQARELLSDPARFQTFFSLAMTAWMNDTPVTGALAETWPVFRDRCIAGLLRASESGERVAVFTSGGVIMAALAAALGASDEIALRLNWRILNASVHVFSASPRGLSLIGYNDISHLRLAQDERLLTFR